MSEAPSLAIVIVTYNVREEIAACLGSLDGQTAAFRTSVIVVDNASTDGTRERVRRQWPQVRVIDAGENLGFARASNLGIRATASEFVLLLNPDTIVRFDAIPLLMRELAAHPEAAAAGPRLVDNNGVAELSFGWTMSPMGELLQSVSRALYHHGVAPFASRIEKWTRQAGELEAGSQRGVALLEAPPLLDQSVDARHEFAWFEGLGEVGVRAARVGGEPVLEIGAGGQEQHGDEPDFRAVLDRLRQLHAVHHRHHHVGDDEVGDLAERQLQAFPAVLRLDELNKIQGGNDTVAPLADTGRYSSCGQPNCGCDTWVDTV